MTQRKRRVHYICVETANNLKIEREGKKVEGREKGRE